MVEKLKVSEITPDPKTQALLRQIGNRDEIIEKSEIDQPKAPGERPDGYLDCTATPSKWSGYQFGLVQAALYDAGLITNLRDKVCGGHTFQDETLEKNYNAVLQGLNIPDGRLPAIHYLASIVTGGQRFLGGDLSPDHERKIKTRLARIIVELGGLTYFEEQSRKDSGALFLLRFMSGPDTEHLIPIFERAVFSEDKTSHHEKASAVEGLQNIGTPRAESVLLQAFDSNETAVLALDALYEMGTPAALRRLEESRERIRKIGEEMKYDMEALLDKAIWKIRERAGQLGDRRIVSYSSPYSYFMDLGYTFNHTSHFETQVLRSDYRYRPDREKIVARISRDPGDRYIVTILDDQLYEKIKANPPDWQRVNLDKD